MKRGEENVAADNIKNKSVLSSSETLDWLIAHNGSFARLEDEVLSYCMGTPLDAQEMDEGLRLRLIEILLAPAVEKCLIGVSGSHLQNTIVLHLKTFYLNYLAGSIPLLNKIIYGDATISRRSVFKQNPIEKIKTLWQDKDVVFVYGKESRFFIHEELFENVKSYEIVYAPSKNAFSEYDAVLNQCLNHSKTKVFLLACGPTATVLAFDLAKHGYRALDIGELPTSYDAHVNRLRIKYKKTEKLSPEFNRGDYFQTNRDVVANGMNSLTDGQQEKRQTRSPNSQILVEAYLYKNLGDDLFIDLLLSRYKNEAADFYLKGKSEHVTHFLKKYPNCYLYHDEPYQKFDAVVKIGGSIFFETSRNLDEHRRLFDTCHAFGISVFVLGSNFGPFQTPEFLEAFQEFFDGCRSVSLRDTKSYSYFGNLPTVKYVPDLVFGYPVKHLNKETKVLGLSLMDFSNPDPYRKGLPQHAKAYEAKMTEIIERYLSHGYKVRLFSFCEVQGDLEACHRIARISDVEIINYMGDINIFLEKFQTCEKIIGNRFHSLILAQLFSIPFFPLIYNEKSANHLKDIGLLEHACFIEDVSKLKTDSLHFVHAPLPSSKVIQQHFLGLDNYLQQKLITVIIPAYNRIKFMKEALEGIFRQTYQNVQIIVIDDASTDETESYVRHLQKDHPNLEYYRNPKNLGASESRKLGLIHAKGDYLVFHDNDDYYTDDRFFETALHIFRNRPHLSFVAGNTYSLQNGKLKSSTLSMSGEVQNSLYLEKFRQGIGKPRSSFPTLFSRLALDKSGWHQMAQMDDTPLHLWALLGGNAYLLKSRVGVYRIHTANLSDQISVDFIINGLTEHKKVYQRAVSKGFSLNHLWCTQQAIITINWYVKHNKISCEDFSLLEGWCLQHIKSAEIKAYLISLKQRIY